MFASEMLTLPQATVDGLLRARAGADRHALWSWGTVGGGLYALCRCRWRTPVVARAHYALALLEEHVEDARALGDA